MINFKKILKTNFFRPRWALSREEFFPQGDASFGEFQKGLAVFVRSERWFEKMLTECSVLPLGSASRHDRPICFKMEPRFRALKFLWSNFGTGIYRTEKTVYFSFEIAWSALIFGYCLNALWVPKEILLGPLF